VIDLEAFGPLLERVEVVLWPLVMDHKRRDVEALPDGGIDVAFVNGAVRLDDQADWSRLLRRKSRLLVSFGACAHMGGVVGLGNLSEPEELLAAAYRQPASVANPDAPLPGADASRPLPVLLPRALPLGEVVPVDYTVPGCPPSPSVVQAALDALLDGPPPPPGAVLAPNAALCETCPRKGSMPERLEITALRRLATSPVDPEACFLAQGLVCLGPGTRQGCQPGCLEAGMPCRGCFGPLDGVRDAGAAALTAFASLLAGGEREVSELAAALPDPAGTFWRYSYAAGLVPRRLPPAGGEGGEA
jgi:F420-non-reducing hydrogenase small subunit